MARISFVELPTGRITASATFFAQAFGWQLTSYGPTYACTMTGDVDLGLQADSQEATAAPLIVIEVNDLEQSLEAVIASGGTVTRETFSFPGGRRFHFVEPGGSELAVLEADRSGAQE